VAAFGAFQATWRQPPAPPARARPALASEVERLHIRPGGIVLTIARIYRTDQRAVETADIIIPVERYALVYDVPVR
jgi:DNA-binding GntR family transcriptional regulator